MAAIAEIRVICEPPYRELYNADTGLVSEQR
jgi:hypothetical protein